MAIRLVIRKFIYRIIKHFFPVSMKHDLLFGVLIGIAASMWTVTGDCNNQSFKSFEIYLIAILFGISTSIVKISTISLVSDMIGMNEVSVCVGQTEDNGRVGTQFYYFRKVFHSSMVP